LRRNEKMHLHSKKASSTMLPELTEFVPAIRMEIVRKVGLENRADAFPPLKGPTFIARNDR
jgi:hypothetical protein